MDVECLFFGVVLDGVAPQLAADPRLPISSERKHRGSVHEGVDPDSAGANARADADGGVDIAAPDAGGKAVVTFASSTECSRVSNVRATTTGPKTSARAMSMAVVTFSIMVGAMKRPFDSSLRPPARTFAPFCSAALTWLSILPR